ncbi:UNVERIFIED_CONTAM: hypothetical protein K2H54_044051 [Gekko kuhli]
MAESLPFSTETPVPSWDLEAWYEDLQEVLSSDVTNRTGAPVGGEELVSKLGRRAHELSESSVTRTEVAFIMLGTDACLEVNEETISVPLYYGGFALKICPQFFEQNPQAWRRTGPPKSRSEKEFIEADGSTLLWSLETSNLLEPGGGEAAGTCGLGPDLTDELLELLGEEPPGPAESDCSHSSQAQTGTDDEEGVPSGRKRKRSGQPQGGKRQRGREREQENERRVAELTAHNQRLQEEIERLSAEVEATRAALIQRMVNLKT